jgi:hypothetical protein
MSSAHSYRIIRRRIAWLVGNWVGEDLPQATRTKIYSLLIHLISRNDSTDTAIRLTAARSLAKCDTWDFDQESFVPFLPAAIEEIVSLLGEVTLADSQMRLNVTLGVVIDRVGIHVSLFRPSDGQYDNDEFARVDCTIRSSARSDIDTIVVERLRESFPNFDPSHTDQARGGNFSCRLVRLLNHELKYGVVRRP